MDPVDLPVIELAFPGPERDSGVAAVLAGRKTALTGFLGATPVIDDGTLVITERFCLVKADDSAGH
jgi:hypothetical protein